MRHCAPTAIALAVILAAAPAVAQTAADSAAIRATALDYIDGWWSADAQRMASALHPELVKRIRGTDPTGSREWIDNMGASRLVQGTGRGGGRETPVTAQRSDVRILDIFQNTASVRVDAGPWVDHLQMVRWGGRWVILNVLWEMRKAS
ncbi:MAG TPA: nuclear transport factor 2 family protein [Gemmatimonadaceae bacterium]|nr:nuclear transport factor 2 family protein [Gemmatimonadaceae bacterium]